METYPSTIEPLAKHLKRWRGKRYQKEVASLLDLSLPTYRKYENGKRTPNKLAMAELLRRLDQHDTQGSVSSKVCGTPDPTPVSQQRPNNANLDTHEKDQQGHGGAGHGTIPKEHRPSGTIKISKRNI